jgi:hypothetical protein
MLFPGGSTNNSASPPAIFVLQAHNWQEEPHVSAGTRIGRNPLSQYLGAQELSAYETFNLVLPRAGGRFGAAGDYLYHGYMMEQNTGVWGLFRVQPGAVVVGRAEVDAGGRLAVEGFSTRGAGGKFAASVDVSSAQLGPDGKVQPATKKKLATVAVDRAKGAWRLDPPPVVKVDPNTVIIAESSPGSAPAQPCLAPVRVEAPRQGG